jgi:hypothetical protein
VSCRAVYPYWRRELQDGTLALVFTGEQALSLAAELRGLLAEAAARPVRVDELAHQLAFDSDLLRSARRAKR